MSRSAAVYGGAALLAMALGAGVAMMQPKAPSTTVSLTGPAESVDPRAVQERLVEELVEASRGAADVGRIPAFDTVVAMLEGDHPEVLARLQEADVPEALAIGLARALSRRGVGPERAAALLEPWLIRRSQDAVDAAQYRDEVRLVRDPVTGARVGVYRSIVMVWGAPVAWNPVAEGGAFVLQLERGGATVVTAALPDGVSEVLPRLGSTPKIRVSSID